MALRTGDAGYGSLAKAQHWLTLLVVAAQRVVGYSLDLDAA
jgi:cytochrome b561